jgi:hypothetical protein
MSRARAKRPIADVTPAKAAPPVGPADDETRIHRAVDRTTAWPVAAQPTTRITTSPGARPEPPAGPTGQPANRRGRAARVAGLALVAAAAIVVAVIVGLRSSEPVRNDTGGVATGTPDPKHPPQRDVSLDECKVDRDGAHVGGTVRNPTDDPATYVVEVHLVSDAGASITSASLPTRSSSRRRRRRGRTLPPVPRTLPTPHVGSPTSTHPNAESG